MSAPAKTPLPPPPTDAEVLDAGLRHRAGYLPEGRTLASLHTISGESSTSIPEGCAGLLAPGFEACGHVLLGRNEHGHAVVPPGPLPSTTIVHRGATGTGKTHFAQRVVDAALATLEPMQIIVVTPRRTLAHKLGRRRLKVPCYLDLDHHSPDWTSSMVVTRKETEAHGRFTQPFHSPLNLPVWGTAGGLLRQPVGHQHGASGWRAESGRSYDVHIEASGGVIDYTVEFVDCDALD